MTKQLIDRMPEKVRYQIDLLRKDYKNDALSKSVVTAQIRGYAKGLRDAGLISDYERGVLCVYCTTC